MNPPAEPQDTALRRSALETISRATRAGVSLEALQARIARDADAMERSLMRMKREGWMK